MSRQAVRQFVWFVAFGLGAATLHFGCLAALTSGGAPPLAASQIGFVVGGLFSYVANKLVTFRSSARHRAAGPRYVASMGIGWVINGVAFAVLDGSGAGLYAAQLGATCLVALCSFLLQKYWAFQT